MPNTNNIRWKRIAAEGAAIVVSILLAFSIQAWWDDRIEREAELWLLERLHADFIEIRATLQGVEFSHRRSYDACVDLLNIVVRGEPLPITPDVDAMVAHAFILPRTFKPGPGAVTVFLNSEASRLVRNQPLANLLVTWSGVVEEFQEEEVQLMKGVTERWTPYLAARTGLGPYITAFGTPLSGGLPEHISTPAERTPLIVDMEFVNQILNRFTWEKTAISEIEPLQATLDEIIELLNEEIGAR